MRDFRRLRTLVLADSLIVQAYAVTKAFPADERYRLQSQIRRAALSAATNIVEGSARRTTREYLQFLRTALGSAVEVSYLLEVGERLGFLPCAATAPLRERYDHLVRMLRRQSEALERIRGRREPP